MWPSKVSKACQGILARALVSALRCGLCPFGHRPLRRAKVKNSTEFRLDAFVPTTGDQRKEHNDEPGERELAAAGKVLGTSRGDRLNKLEEKREQSIIKIDRSRHFLGVILFILVQRSVHECFDAICSHKIVS